MVNRKQKIGSESLFSRSVVALTFQTGDFKGMGVGGNGHGDLELFLGLDRFFCVDGPR